MVLVLDTHTFLWLLEGNLKLPESIRRQIEDLDVDLCLPALAGPLPNSLKMDEM